MAISITGYHNQNAIIAKIQTALTAILTDLNITGWQVLRNNQPTIQALQNKSVYYDIISKRRIGTQGVKSVQIEVQGVKTWQDLSVWYEEYLIQVGAFLQRNPDTDTVSTMSSSDIIALLQGCINSNGAINGKNYFESDWLQLIKSTGIRELDYETDSGLKEKMPQFDFLLVVEQQLTKGIEKVDNIEMDVKRV
ncbi:MAG: hypothetical protein IKY15_00275 [Clostridia bacterium]|nr:hypothetical protein [Clostridia bacterium]